MFLKARAKGANTASEVELQVAGLLECLNWISSYGSFSNRTPFRKCKQKRLPRGSLGHRTIIRGQASRICLRVQTTTKSYRAWDWKWFDQINSRFDCEDTSDYFRSHSERLRPFL